MCGEDWILLDYFKIVSIFPADRYVLASLSIVSFSGISAVFFFLVLRGSEVYLFVLSVPVYQLWRLFSFSFIRLLKFLPV